MYYQIQHEGTRRLSRHADPPAKKVERDMPVKLDIPDKRMLELAAWAVANQYADSEGDYWQAIGFARTSISKVRSGTQSFTVAQITSACKLTGASADWVLGLGKEMFREG